MTIPIIEKLGGRSAICEELQKKLDKPITKDVVRMWQSRGSLPGYAAIALVEMAKQNGIEFDPRDYTPPQGGAL